MEDETAVEGVSLHNWEARRQGSERDVREAKFLLTANVAALLALKEYYDLEPLNFLNSTTEIAIFVPFFASTFAAALVLTMAYSRERCILAVMAGRDLTVSWASTVNYAKSGWASRLISWTFLTGVVVFCLGISTVVLLAEKGEQEDKVDNSIRTWRLEISATHADNPE